MDFLSWFALILLIFVICTLAYGMVAMTDIPYRIAKKRNHPHQDAIHSACWVSLFTLQVIWPFIWIWAVAYHPAHGYKGISREKKDHMGEEESEDTTSRLVMLEKRITSRASVAVVMLSGYPPATYDDQRKAIVTEM
jgi:hypothetical protein